MWEIKLDIGVGIEIFDLANHTSKKLSRDSFLFFLFHPFPSKDLKFIIIGIYNLKTFRFLTGNLILKVIKMYE